MNWKKLGWVLMALIALVLLVNWQFGEGGIFTKVKDAVKSVIGTEAMNVTTVKLSSEQSISMNSLEKAINGMLKDFKKHKKPCFEKYQKLPSLEKNDVTIKFSYSQGKTSMIIEKGTESRLIEDIKEIPGMVPCVIGGKVNGEEVSENFYYKFLEPNPEKVKGDFYLPVNEIKIAYDTSGYNENRISFGGGGFADFEGDGWLFTPDGKHVCFFPTHDARNGPYGLNDDHIPYLLSKSGLPLCSWEQDK